MEKKNKIGFISELEKTPFDKYENKFVAFQHISGNNTYYGKFIGVENEECILKPCIDIDYSSGVEIYYLANNELSIPTHLIGAKKEITKKNIENLCKIQNQNVKKQRQISTSYELDKE